MALLTWLRELMISTEKRSIFMIIDARNGNTANGFRKFTVVGEVSHALNGIPVGGKIEVKGLVNPVGVELPLVELQRRMAAANRQGMTLRSANNNGVVTIWRLA